MIDIGKVADLVLLMVDGSFGFEMVRFNHAGGFGVKWLKCLSGNI